MAQRAESWQEFSRTPIANLTGTPILAGNPIANHMPPEIGAHWQGRRGGRIVIGEGEGVR